ncbi:DUF2406 domain-containing protein [Aspergillus lucknowensis]|uniref:Uncharacterized protein n=1 Tax=Aspergillus lucknowensis TaxID=176173 RepID=A0ABR4LYK7_9EURO
MPSSLASSGSSQSDKKTTLSGKSDELGTTTHLKQLWNMELGPNFNNPRAAVVEDGPALSLSAIQHLDRQGKVIADPDRSNPTRPRLERPLDTIRGFEAAIEARRGRAQVQRMPSSEEREAL